MIKAVIFDMDGVIIDNQPYQKQAWNKLFMEYGFDISDDDLSKKIRGRPTIDGLRNYFKNRFSETKLKEIAQRKEELYKDVFGKNFAAVKGFVLFLHSLKASGFLVALATSSTEDLLDFTMSRLKVRQYFDAITTSDEITKNKPNPDIYLKTAGKLGVLPEQCVVFEDSLSGVEAAKSAGMKVVLVMTVHRHDEFKGIDMAINDFTEIKASDISKI